MKIVIENTNKSRGKYLSKHTMEVPHDDLTWTELLEEMIFPMLTAMGYSITEKQRKDYLGEYLSELEELGNEE